MDIDSIISNVKGLEGYTDITSALGSYQHYGVCYGYGEDDPDGGGSVANGVWNKGNVFVQVHLVSSSDLSSEEGDMSAIMGAATQ